MDHGYGLQCHIFETEQPASDIGEGYVTSIERHGLLPKSRLYVHLSTDYDTAIKVGSRHGRPVVYEVNAGAMAADGYDFYLSANGVWLAKRVPVEYLKKLGAKE